jgi:hypothetical protein
MVFLCNLFPIATGRQKARNYYMKKTVATLIVVVVTVVALHAFRALQPVPAQGRITTKQKVEVVKTVGYTDTLKTN